MSTPRPKEIHFYESQVQAAQEINLSVDLIGAARRQLSFLRAVHCVPGLHRGPAVSLAVKRYYNFWMPLAADRLERVRRPTRGGSTSLLPPFDVQWVWHCHRLHPMAYRRYCSTHFKKVIDFPILTDAEGEASARERCRMIWTQLYPKEPFDILPHIRKLATGQVYPIEEHDDNQDEENEDEEENELISAIARQSTFYYQVSLPYMWDERFLRAALQRYKCFLHLLRKSEGKILCVPTYDIDLIWHAHQLSPLAYSNDTHALFGCVMDHDDSLVKGPNTKLEHGFQDTVRLWENTFGQPYEKAGSMSRGMQPLTPTSLRGEDGGFERVPLALPWSYQPKDVNRDLKVLTPRYLMEVCILIKSDISDSSLRECGNLFFRLKALDATKLMKLDTPLNPYGGQPQWQKLWLLQCEASIKAMNVELRCQMQSCLKTLAAHKLGETLLNLGELQESPLLSVDRVFPLKRRLFHGNHVLPKTASLRVGASITPPVPAPYLLKSVPDRVTDDQGEMISKLYLRMRRNQPQEGRWLSRTVLDHTGKECFVIRIRAAKGIWRKGKDRPVGVDWNERVIHICEGGWSYISGSTGKAPVKVVATANPLADDLGHYKLRWSLSSGEMLTISRSMEEPNWESNLYFSLDGSPHGLVRLLNGRKLAYTVLGASADDEEGFVTVVRHTPDAPQGKATALFNWKLSAMDIYPEEDVLLVMLLCTSILRSVADLGGKNYENIHARRRTKEMKPGSADWGSVIVDNPSSQSDLMLWYVNPEKILAPEEGAPSLEVEVDDNSICGTCASICGVGVDWEAAKSFADETSRHIGFGMSQDRRTGSGAQLEMVL